VQFADSATGSPQVVTLTGTGQAATQNLIFSPTAIVFPQSNIGTLVTGSTTVTNYGTASTNFTGTAITGPNAGDFALVSNNCTPLAPATSCTITVSFTPQAAGVRTATLQVQDTATGSPQNVPLAGTGLTITQTIGASPAALVFNAQNVGTSATNYVTLENYGTGSSTFTSYVISGRNASEFTLSSNSCPYGSTTLGPQQSCLIYVTFTPSAVGIAAASLTVTDSALGSPQVIPLSGTGQSVTAQLTFSEGAVSFAGQNVGTTSGVNTLYLQSAGDTPVSISAIAVGGTNASDFQVNYGTCVPGTTLTGNQQCYVQVQFTPTAAGSRTATITFTDNASGSPQSVALEGIGQTSSEQLYFSYLTYDFGVSTVSRAFRYREQTPRISPLPPTGASERLLRRGAPATSTPTLRLPPRALAPLRSCLRIAPPEARKAWDCRVRANRSTPC
jgi:hypothetical protein